MVSKYNTVTTGWFALFVGAAVPPWVGYNGEETIQQQILALSAVSLAPFVKMFIFIWKDGVHQ